MLCSRADLLTNNVDLKHERKTKRILGGYFKIKYLYIKAKTMDNIRKFIKTTIREYLNENQNNDVVKYSTTMKDKIDLIFSDLKNEVITEKQAHQQVLDLFAVMQRSEQLVCDKCVDGLNKSKSFEKGTCVHCRKKV